MISKVNRETLDWAVENFKAEVGRQPELQDKLPDLYERAQAKSEPGSKSERAFQDALQTMDAALKHVNEELVTNKEAPLTMTGLLPELLKNSAAAVINQTDAEAPPISPVVAKLATRLDVAMVGQEEMRHALLISFITGGHVLLEGAPGVGKTEAVKVLTDSLQAKSGRIQFTPDTTPTDVTGFTAYDEPSQSYKFRPGPIFSPIVFADEINRAPGKTQAAFFEPMAEKHVTVDGEKRPLEDGFTVYATQNPFDGRGTFLLPPAQLDRFMFCVNPPFATPDEEVEIDRRQKEGRPKIDADISMDELLEIRQQVSQVHVPEELLKYAAMLKEADPHKQLQIRAGTRAFFALRDAAQANAYIDGRTVVSEEDIRAMFPNVIRHRVELTTDAIDRNVSIDDYIEAALASVVVVGKGQ